MNFLINRFSILAPNIKKAFSENFEKKINLIVGEKDSGKTSLVRSILYTLGCDVKNFDFLNNMPENIYILEFSIEDDNYIIIRKKLKKGKGSNFFKIIKNLNQYFYFHTTGALKDYINEIMNIKLTTLDKDGKETKLYPNHIFLPFYTDQDNSWQNYLSSTFNGINFIQNYKKLVLEYFTGARSNKYYELKLENDKLKNDKLELDALIKSKELILEENTKNIKIIESIDIEGFQNQYNYFLEVYQNIIETEHKLKNNLNEKIYEKNSLLEMKEKLNSSIENIIESELKEICPNCNQTIHKDMEENYRLFLSQQNLIKEREKINMFLEDIKLEVEKSKKELKLLKYTSKDLENKLNNDSKDIELSERANSYAFSKINEIINKELSTLKIKRDDINEELKVIESNLKKLNEIDVSTKYKTLMIDSFKKLEIELSYNNYYNSNLESVNINLSGATKNQAFIAQYLTIFEMSLSNDNVINIPMFIDTYVKDNFNLTDSINNDNFIFKKLEKKFQSFIFIADNEHTLKSIKEFDYKEIRIKSKKGLFTKDYNLLYNEYKDLLEKEC